MLTYRAFDEAIDFITSLPNPKQVLDYRPSEFAQNRLDILLDKKRSGSLNEKESHEIEQYMMIEHLMRMAKKKARKQMDI